MTFVLVRCSECPLFPLVTSKTSDIRANFENLAKEREQEDRRKAEAERAQRMAKERQEQEEARRKLEVSNDAVPILEPSLSLQLGGVEEVGRGRLIPEAFVICLLAAERSFFAPS